MFCFWFGSVLNIDINLSIFGTFMLLFCYFDFNLHSIFYFMYNIICTKGLHYEYYIVSFHCLTVVNLSLARCLPGSCHLLFVSTTPDFKNFPQIIEYENRIRQYSTPDKVFRYFATIEVPHPHNEREIFMTPSDFLTALTPGKIN